MQQPVRPGKSSQVAVYDELHDPGLQGPRCFADRRRIESAKQGLMNFPDPSPADCRETEGLSRVLNVLHQNIIIEHPHFPVRLALSRSLGARICYLLAVGDYEQPELDLMARYMKKSDTLLDIGGCAGVTAALAAWLTEREIVVVEPNPQMKTLIEEQVRLNGGRVTVLTGCLGPDVRNKTVDFYLHSEPWRSKLAPEENERNEYERIKCTVFSLHELIDRWRPSVLMIDVEGAERMLITTQFSRPPRLIIIEINNFIIGDKASCELIQNFFDLGYRLIDRSGWNWAFELIASAA